MFDKELMVSLHNNNTCFTLAAQGSQSNGQRVGGLLHVMLLGIDLDLPPKNIQRFRNCK